MTEPQAVVFPVCGWCDALIKFICPGRSQSGIYPFQGGVHITCSRMVSIAASGCTGGEFQLPERRAQSLQRLGKRRARTGDVEALEPVPGQSEDGAIVQPKPGFVHNTAGQLIMGEPVPPKIHPKQIGPLRFYQTGVGQMHGQIVPEQIPVAGDIGFDLLQPGLPLLIRRLGGDQAQGIDQLMAK